MAAKSELERTYNVPLRKEFMKVPRWRKTKKAVSALRQFLARHMKSEDIRLGTSVNEKLWNHGGKNPPHHIKVIVKKDKEGVVRAELFGAKVKEEKVPKKKEAVKKQEATPTKEESKSVEDMVTAEEKKE